MDHNNDPITAPSYRDVLNGRGQGVQRHPGNVKYRALVFVNKGLYAKCARADKIKISKGIVAAVRELGGRFLQEDERNKVFYDIGNKKATEKTSQALREGQTKIRKDMYQSEKQGGNISHDTSLISSIASAKTVPTSNVQPSATTKEVSEEGYFGYSVQVLEALFNSDNDLQSKIQCPAPDYVSSTPSVAVAAAAHPHPPVNQHPPVYAPAMNVGAPGIATNQLPPALLDQFPTAGMSMHAQQQNQNTEQYQQPMIDGRGQLDRRGQMASMNSFNLSLNRLSLGSMFSIRQLVDTARDTVSGEDRQSSDSILTLEICDLIRQSEARLKHVEDMHMEDLNPSEQEMTCFDDDSFTNFKFSDPSTNSSSRGTDYSKISMMDSSIRTFERDNSTATLDTASDELSSGSAKRMKLNAAPGMAAENRRTGLSCMSLGSGGDDEMAQLLLRLSNDGPTRNSDDSRASLVKTTGSINLFAKERKDS